MLLPLTAARSSIFLSTPSARRATSRRTSSRSAFGYFYPRPPRGGRQRKQQKQRRLKSISIHALREEGDARHPTNKRSATKFLSTPSARRATKAEGLGYTHGADFYPRPPRGGRRIAFRDLLIITKISIHALREEGDGAAAGVFGYSRISIHALREEGDSKNRDKISIFKQIIQHSARI